jgi:hypothetical protein
MIWVTVRASLTAGITEAWADYAANPWAIATLVDAYCGFLIFYAWVAYKERRAAGRIVWFVLIMGLGNMATALYLLLALQRLRPGERLRNVLLRAEA